MALSKPVRNGWQRLGFWRWVIVLMCLLGAAGAAYYYTRADESAQVVTAPVSRGDVEVTVLATGTVEAAKTVEVGAQASGQIKRLFVQLGDRVQKGDLLAEIDPEVSQNALDEALANIDNLKIQQSIRQLALEEAQRELDRQRTMMTGDATPKKEFDSAQSMVKTRQAEVLQIGAQLRQAEIKRSTAQANLGYTRIVAPMEGVVVSIAAKEGQTVNANQSTPTILTLADLDTMKIKAQVAEADVIRLREGLPLYFSILGAPERRFDAHLVGIEPLPQTINNAVFYSALFNVPNKRGLLRPQMTAQVTFVLASARDVLTVPLSALQRVPGEKGRGKKASGAQGSRAQSTELTDLAKENPRQSMASAVSQGQPIVPNASQIKAERSGPIREDAEANQGRNGFDVDEKLPRERKAKDFAVNDTASDVQAQQDRELRKERRRAERLASAVSGDETPSNEVSSEPRRRHDYASSTSAVGTKRARQSVPNWGEDYSRTTQSTVSVRSAEGKLESRKVTVGLRSAVAAEIRAGLKEGDEVVVGKVDPNASAKSPQGGQSAVRIGGAPGGRMR